MAKKDKNWRQARHSKRRKHVNKRKRTKIERVYRSHVSIEDEDDNQVEHGQVAEMMLSLLLPLTRAKDYQRRRR